MNAEPRDLFGMSILPKRRDEDARQAAIVEYVRLVAPQILIWHVPNGGFRLKSEAARLKWMGLLPGVPDLSLVLPGGHSAYWECKTPKGRLSRDQIEFLRQVDQMGHSWAIVRDIDDARLELARLGVVTREAAA